MVFVFYDFEPAFPKKFRPFFSFYVKIKIHAAAALFNRQEEIKECNAISRKK